MKELILGGQKSGKSRAAESRAQAWLAIEGHEAVLIATALPDDAEMAHRIAHHQVERQRHTPGLQTVEESQDVADAVRLLSRPHRLVLIDCLTLWLTQITMPLEGSPAASQTLGASVDALADAVLAASGPVVLVSNEIGLGVVPLSPEARRFVDILGLLHQRMAAACDRVTLMVAGCELNVRRESA